MARKKTKKTRTKKAVHVFTFKARSINNPTRKDRHEVHYGTTTGRVTFNRQRRTFTNKTNALKFAKTKAKQLKVNRVTSGVD